MRRSGDPGTRDDHRGPRGALRLRRACRDRRRRDHSRPFEPAREEGGSSPGSPEGLAAGRAATLRMARRRRAFAALCTPSPRQATQRRKTGRRSRCACSPNRRRSRSTSSPASSASTLAAAVRLVQRLEADRAGRVAPLPRPRLPVVLAEPPRRAPLGHRLSLQAARRRDARPPPRGQRDPSPPRRAGAGGPAGSASGRCSVGAIPRTTCPTRCSRSAASATRSRPSSPAKRTARSIAIVAQHSDRYDAVALLLRPRHLLADEAGAGGGPLAEAGGAPGAGGRAVLRRRRPRPPQRLRRCPRARCSAAASPASGRCRCAAPT